MTLPSRSQKCDLQPFLNHTDGCNVGRPRESVLHVHLGVTSCGSESSIVRPQPHGHLNPTHQSSEPSLTRIKERRGSWLGRTSPCTTCNFLAGSRPSTQRYRTFFTARSITHHLPSQRSQGVALRRQAQALDLRSSGSLSRR